jgi:uncharacterized membrane protein YdjX (TVP38/TMEM64 family)
MRTKQQKILIKGTIFVLLVALIFLLSRYGPQPFSVLGPLGENVGKFYTRKGRLVRFLISLGPYSSAIFILLQAFQVIVSPIPGELTGAVGGYVYGASFGFLFSTLGLTLGSWAAFEIADILGKPFLGRFIRRETLEKFNFLSTNTGAAICFLLFLLPGFPKDVLCYVLGLTGMRLSTFLLVSTLGRMPGTYLLTIQGASLRSQDYLTAAMIAVISAIAVFVGYLYRDHFFHWIKSKGHEKSR